MAMLQRDGTEHFRGPWLLTTESLAELESIFEQTRAQLHDQWTEFVSAKVASARAHGLADQATIEKRYPPPSILYSIQLDAKRTMTAKSLDELRSQHEVATASPSSLQLALSTEEAAYKFSARRGTNKIRVSASGPGPAAQLFLVRMKDWAASHGSRTSEVFWLRFRPLIWIAMVLALLVRVPDRSSTEAEGIWKSKALEYAQHAIPQEEIPNALQLLIVTQVVPEVQQSVMSNREAVGWLVALLSCHALSFCPSVIIGLGKGASSLPRLRAWMRFATYTIPALVLTTVLWPLVVSWVAQLIR